MRDIYPSDLATVVHQKLGVWADGANPDPNHPSVLRPPRWTSVPLSSPIAFTVANIAKLCRAADPWTSWIAVFGTSATDLTIWGLYDQTVHYNTSLVRESAPSWSPPGLFQVAANGVADLTVYYETTLVARLARDRIIENESDVFWSGPIRDRLYPAIVERQTAVITAVGKQRFKKLSIFGDIFAEGYVGTLCRLLISIQKVQHGGAILITPGRADLRVKYEIDYDRLPRFMKGLDIHSIRLSLARDEFEFNYSLANKTRMPIPLFLDNILEEHYANDFRDGMTGAVRFISSLANVDGLVLLRPSLTVVGFGVEIQTKNDPDDVFVSSTPKPSAQTIKRISPEHYGMRHRSMMRYCYAHRGSVGFVISQDGDIRAMTRVGSKLIMWQDIKIHERWDEEFARLKSKPTSYPDGA